MNFTLLPFLLAARVISNDTNWDFGPEYTFCGKMSMMTSLHEDRGDVLGSHLLMKMKCRPKSEDTLSCRFKDGKIAKTQLENYDIEELRKLPENLTFVPYGMGCKEPFEIQFRKNGILAYIVGDTDPPFSEWGLSMVRLVADQLNYAVEFSGSTRGEFKKLDNFTAGECETMFYVKKGDESVNNVHLRNDREPRNFELEFLDGLDKFANSDDVVQITKIRDFANCLQRSKYLFGSRHTFGFIMRDTLQKLKSSIMRLTFSKDGLKSETVNEADVYDLDRKKLGTVMDSISLTLESIEPAEETIKKISNPEIHEVVACD